MYSLKTGVWKTIKNGLIMFAPAMVAFVTNMPHDIQTQYALPLGLVLYFFKNLKENR